MEIKIKNGMLEGLVIDEQFSSRGSAGTDRTVKVCWDFTGLDMHDLKTLIWGNFKVVVQRTTLSKMTDQQIRDLNGKTLFAKDYMKANAGGQTAALKAQVAEQEARLKEIAKTFMNIALSEATAELGPGASNEAVQNVTMRIFNEKYAALVK